MDGTLEVAKGFGGRLHRIERPNAKLGHIPGLDGLRGLALLGVLFFHADGLLTGGYLGVDLFFVLSGYLITTLLLVEHAQSGRIALGAFWVRRARRLFPALLSLMPAVAIYARVLAKPREVAGIRADALATLGYVANWRAVLSHKTYWELFASPSPLEHTWSLSIEEQFYVVWPVLVWGVLRAGGRRTLAIVTTVLAALSMVAMVAWFDPAATTRSYYGTDARATAILAGALLAMALAPNASLAGARLRALDALGVAALAGLGVAWWRLEGTSRFLYHGGFWLTELAGVVLVACAVAGSAGWVARTLAFSPFRWVGTISYGAYLWHWPIDVVLVESRVHLHGAALQSLRVAVTMIVAAVSYRFFEAPIRRKGVPMPFVVIPAAVAVAVLALFVGTRPKPPSAPPPLPPSPSEALVRFRIAMFGDSTANSLGWTLRGLRTPAVAIDLRGLDGFNLLYDTSAAKWTYDEDKEHADAAIVFVGGAFLYGITLGGDYRRACTPKWDELFEAGLAKKLAELVPQKTHVWIATIPQPLGPYDNASFRQQAACVDASIRKVAATVPAATILDLAEMLCPHGECTRESHGVALRPDGVHYDMVGAHDFAQSVLDEVVPHGLLAPHAGVSRTGPSASP